MHIFRHDNFEYWLNYFWQLFSFLIVAVTYLIPFIGSNTYHQLPFLTMCTMRHAKLFTQKSIEQISLLKSSQLLVTFVNVICLLYLLWKSRHILIWGLLCCMIYDFCLAHPVLNMILCFLYLTDWQFYKVRF